MYLYNRCNLVLLFMVLLEDTSKANGFCGSLGEGKSQPYTVCPGSSDPPEKMF
mgnify:CR=1 FL=1